ncbi:MAG: hypothetical protein V2A66_05530 [Pseudomonadota bacterium]
MKRKTEEFGLKRKELDPQARRRDKDEFAAKRRGIMPTNLASLNKMPRGGGNRSV